MLHAVIEVDFLSQVSVVVDFFLVDVDFVKLLMELFEFTLELVLVCLTGSGVDAVLGGFDTGLVEFLLFVDVVRPHTSKGVFVIAVEVDQRLEAVLLPGIKEPVNRTLLVTLAMVGVEVIEEVITDHLTGKPLAAGETIGNEQEIIHKVLLAKGCREPCTEAVYNIVLKVFIITNRDNSILVRVVGFIF